MSARAAHSSSRTVRISEAARYARVSPGTVRRWVRDGRLPGVRVGPRLVHVDLDDVDTLIVSAGPAVTTCPPSTSATTTATDPAPAA